jgi:predicted nucleic acid-binding protein
MNFLDTSVIVAALLEKHPEHAASAPLLSAPDSVSNVHCLAEAFATLTAKYRLRNADAAALLLDRPLAIAQALSKEDYTACLAAPARVQGGGIYDALHAAFARRLKVEQIFTHNISNFEHHASDLKIARPALATEEED